MNWILIMAWSWSLIYYKFMFFSFFWKLNTGTFISYKFNIFLIFTWTRCLFNFFLFYSWCFSRQNYSFLNIIYKIFFRSVSSRPWSNINFFLKKPWFIHFQSRSRPIFCEIEIYIFIVMSRSWSNFYNFLFWFTTENRSFQIIGLIWDLKQFFVLVLTWPR